MNFSRINNISGWLVFGIALLVYLMTMEPTTSFWDCGEFIACAYKLQVTHSPGAPLFMLLGRLFAIFSPSPQSVAMFVNALSAFASAFTILFLFWSITHFAKRLVKTEDGGFSTGNMIAVIGAGFVGALAYTFSDTFWFSAVEGEVYATSSFFTALVFWCILKWEEANDVYADRWLVLIAYLIGLSTGVHLLSLLAIPTIALIYYFKRYTPTLKGSLLAYFLGGVVLLVVQYGVIQYIPILASKFELAFVNSMGMPLHSGAIFFLLLFGAVLAGIIIFAKRTKRYTLHVAMLSLVFISIGYTCYVPVIIRAKAGVSINMTNPDNIVSLIPYLQRTQYGSTPFLTGQYFTTQGTQEYGDPIYLPVTKDGKTKYEIVDQTIKVNYEDKHFFPRIWSNDESRGHVSYYRGQLGLANGEEPTAMDNMKFFMSYQMNHMFWRYFMWNYAGRQNDYQGSGIEPHQGNWITGINAVDKAMGRGDFNKLPDAYKNNRAHNTMFMLPFILGILGIVYQFKKNKLDGWVVLSFWFFTGIAVQLYINNTPYQPRERDYQYIATYAYAIWIGIGVFFLRDLLMKAIKNPGASAAIATIVCLFAGPVLIASQEWDDHDRGKKTLALDNARNMLSTCDSNAILITSGDNETYPLWYIQEVEGFRTDVRIFNYNLMGTDWQNIQMFNKVNDAPPISVLWNKDFVEGFGNTNGFPISEIPSLKDKVFNVNEVMAFMMDERNGMPLRIGDKKVPFVPVRNISIPLDKAAMMKNGKVSIKDSTMQIPDQLVVQFKDSYVGRPDLSMMNIIAGIAKDGWNRSLYVCNGIPVCGLEGYLKKEGILNKLVPVEMPNQNFTDIDRNMELFTKVYTFGKANTNQVYYDEPNKRTFYAYRNDAAAFAIQLVNVGRKADAVKILDNSMAQISEASFPTDVSVYEMTGVQMFNSYLAAGEVKKAEAIGDRLAKFTKDFTNYFVDLNDNGQMGAIGYVERCIRTLSMLSSSANGNKQPELAKKYNDQLTSMSQRLESGSQVFKEYMMQMMRQNQAAGQAGGQ